MHPPPPPVEHHIHHRQSQPHAQYVQTPPPKKKLGKWKIIGLVVGGLWAMGMCGGLLEETKARRIAKEKATALAAMTPEQRAEVERREQDRQYELALQASQEAETQKREAEERAKTEKREAEERAKAAAQREADKRKPIANVTGIQLTSFYDENEVAADEALKGRFVHVTGKITDIKKDFMDDVYLVMQGERGRFSLKGVHVSLDEGHDSVAANIRKNRKYSFVCKVNGLIMLSVMLKECRLQ